MGIPCIISPRNDVYKCDRTEKEREKNVHFFTLTLCSLPFHHTSLSTIHAFLFPSLPAIKPWIPCDPVANLLLPDKKFKARKQRENETEGRERRREREGREN